MMKCKLCGTETHMLWDGLCYYCTQAKENKRIDKLDMTNDGKDV